MPKITPFEKYVEQYEAWFVKNRWVYEAELRAVKAMLPAEGLCVESGVGTGRFAEPLRIKIGIEPSKRMRGIAQQRGIQVINGVAEELPFQGSKFDFALMVTTICFVDNAKKAILEAHRVLSYEGFLIIGFVDRSSMMGQVYLDRQKKALFTKRQPFFLLMNLLKL